MRNFSILSAQRKLFRFCLFLGLLGLFSFVSLGMAAEIISAGQDHTCGVKADGSVVCWGSNFYGQTEQPTEYFTQVSINTNYNCGLKTDGNVVCWGISYYDDIEVPSGTFIQIDIGYNHACGLKIDGDIGCWGRNDDGQATPPDGSFTQISSGDFHSCGIRLDGSVMCWGNNAGGKANPPVWSFTQISAGNAETCGVKTNGDVECWGTGSKASSGSFTQVSVGTGHVCGIKTDGTVECWGTDHYGEATPPEGIFVQISAGQSHTCGLRTDGNVECWGKNDDGQATPPAGVRFALPDVEITPETSTTLTYEEGLEAGKQFCINEPAACGIQINPRSRGIKFSESVPIFDVLTGILTIPAIDVFLVDENGVEYRERYEGEMQTSSDDLTKLSLTSLINVDTLAEESQLSTVPSDDPKIGLAEDFVKEFLLQTEQGSKVVKVLNAIDSVNKLSELLNGLERHSDDPVKQVLYGLEFFLRYSGNVTWGAGKLIDEDTLVKTYEILDGRLTDTVKVIGITETFGVQVKEVRRFFFDKKVSDVEVTIHQMTEFVPSEQMYCAFFETQDFTECTGNPETFQGDNTYGNRYLFKRSNGVGIPTGLYLVEVTRNGEVLKLETALVHKDNQTETVYIDVE